MRATVPLSLIVLSLACTRAEEPQNARAAEATTTTSVGSVSRPAAPLERPPSSAAPASAALSASTAPVASASPSAATSASAPPACVVPMPEQALPQEKPAASCPKDTGVPPKLLRGTVSFRAAKPTAKVSVERARTPGEHQRGLMYRTEMPQNHGMIFEWPEESRRVFWMHNTCIPLDMLFIAKDGTVAGILEQVPVMNDEPRTVPCNASYVLEVNAGWCRRHGVRPGMRATIL